MTVNQLNTKLTNALRGSFGMELKIVLTVAAVLFLANLAYSAYSIGFAHGRAFAISRDYTISGDNFFMTRLRIATTCGLFVCAASLAFRNLFGVVASMLGIVWLVCTYGWWYYRSLAFLRNLEVTDFGALPDISHAAGLLGATWWDVLVFVLVAVLFVWEMAILIRVVIVSRHDKALE